MDIPDVVDGTGDYDRATGTHIWGTTKDEVSHP